MDIFKNPLFTLRDTAESFLSLFHAIDGYRIATFNIRKFGYSSISKKALPTISKIIKNNNIDILAIQEITHPSALEALMKHLDGPIKAAFTPRLTSQRTQQTKAFKTAHWEGRWAAPNSIYGGTAGEGYAFLWNSKRIQLVSNYKGQIFEPRIESFSRKTKLVRPPFIGRFTPIGSRFELRLINTHIVFSKTKDMKDENSDLYVENTSDISLRQDELRVLLEHVYIRLDKKQYDCQHIDTHAKLLAPYTFLCGDYNLNLSTANAASSSARIPPDLEYFTKEGSEIITVNNKLSTLCAIPTDPTQASAHRKDPIVSNHLSNNFDHFSYDCAKLASKQITKPHVDVINAYQEYRHQASETQSEFELYMQNISDHLPVYLDFNIKFSPSLSFLSKNN